MLKNQNKMDSFKAIVWDEFEKNGITKENISTYFKRTPMMTVYATVYDDKRYSLTFPLVMIHMPEDYQRRIIIMTCMDCIDKMYRTNNTLMDMCIKDRKSGRFVDMHDTYLECALRPYEVLNEEAENTVMKNLSSKAKGLMNEYGFTVVFVSNPSWKGNIVNKMFRTIIVSAQDYEFKLESLESLTTRTNELIKDVLSNREDWMDDETIVP